MKRSNLLKILEEKFKDTFDITDGSWDHIRKTIYFKRKDTRELLNIKCYSYSKNLESDDTKWTFMIYLDNSDYEEYDIPEKDTETYIEMIRDRYLNYLIKKKELDKCIKEIRVLKGRDIDSEIREYKLNKIV